MFPIQASSSRNKVSELHGQCQETCEVALARVADAAWEAKNRTREATAIQENCRNLAYRISRAPCIHRPWHCVGCSYSLDNWTFACQTSSCKSKSSIPRKTRSKLCMYRLCGRWQVLSFGARLQSLECENGRDCFGVQAAGGVPVVSVASFLPPHCIPGSALSEQGHYNAHSPS